MGSDITYSLGSLVLLVSGLVYEAAPELHERYHKLECANPCLSLDLSPVSQQEEEEEVGTRVYPLPNYRFPRQHLRGSAAVIAPLRDGFQRVLE